MDYMLDIIILKRELNKSGLSEILREWGGVKYSVSPALYVTDSDIEFIEINDMSYYSRITGVNFMQDVMGLHLRSNILYDFEYRANRKIENIKENELLVFLKKLFNLSVFYILLIREDETIKERYEITTPEEIESLLLKSVDWSSPKDVMFYKKVLYL